MRRSSCVALLVCALQACGDDTTAEDCKAIDARCNKVIAQIEAELSEREMDNAKPCASPDALPGVKDIEGFEESCEALRECVAEKNACEKAASE